MRNLAIIPARSGSKGLKDKNIKILNGKPLLAYSIEAAKTSDMFSEIMVSTDSVEYGKIAKEWGAEVPFLRSSELSNDIASPWEVVKDILENYKLSGKVFDTVALLQPTSPLRTSFDIVEGYRVLKEKSANFVVAVSEMDHSPLWANILPEDGSMVDFINPKLAKLPRQSMPVYYQINGALYIIKTEYLFYTKDLYSVKSYATVMPKERSVDIDTYYDLVVAETLLNAQKNDLYRSGSLNALME